MNKKEERARVERFYRVEKFYDEWIEAWTLTECDYIKKAFPEAYFAVQKALKYQKEADLLCESMRNSIERE